MKTITFYIVLTCLYFGVLNATGLQMLPLNPEPATSLDLLTAWQQHSASGDAKRYIAMVSDLSSAMQPYRFRIVEPLLVRGLRDIIPGVPTPLAFLVINVVAVMVAALLFTAMLGGGVWGMVGGLLMLTTFSLQNTLDFPLVDAFSYLPAVLLFMALKRRSYIGFALASVFAVLTKEVFIAVVPLYFIYYTSAGTLTRMKIVRLLAFGALPVLAFALVRVAYGDAPASVNYGFNVAAGEVPTDYLERFLPLSYLFFDAINRTWLAFGALWIGIIGCWRYGDRLLRLAVLYYIPLVILSTWVLSSRIMRVLDAPLYPVVIAGAVLLLKHLLNTSPKETNISATQTP